MILGTTVGTVPGAVPGVIRKATLGAIWRQVLGANATAILRMTRGGIGEAMRIASPFVVGEAISTATEKASHTGICEVTCEGTPSATWTASRAVRM